MRSHTFKTLLFLSALLAVQPLRADMDIFPVEIIAVAGGGALVLALLYVYIVGVIAFRVLNRRKGLRKKNKTSSVILGLVFIVLSIFLTSDVRLSTSLAAGALGAVLGYFTAPDPDEPSDDGEPANGPEMP